MKKQATRNADLQKAENRRELIGSALAGALFVAALTFCVTALPYLLRGAA